MRNSNLKNIHLDDWNLMKLTAIAIIEITRKFSAYFQSIAFSFHSNSITNKTDFTINRKLNNGLIRSLSNPH